MNRKSRRGDARQFALCVNAGGYPASLQRRKLYELRPDPEAERLGQLRVVDDSGQDYLYPREYFQPVALTPFLRRLLTGNAPKRTGRPRPSRRPSKMSTKP